MLRHYATRLQTKFREVQFSSSVRLLHGPERPPGGPRDVVAMCLIREGMPYLPHFLRHHRALGIRHFLFLDNKSADGTRDFLRRQPDVTLFASDLPFGTFQHAARRFLLRRIGRHRWLLVADIDECFDYPSSDSLPLHSFLEYLEHHDFDAVAAQMLDLFQDGPLLQARDPDDGDLAQAYRHFDLSTLTREPHATWFGTTNRLGNPALQSIWGGIRFSAFNAYNILTKHPLMRLRGSMTALNNPHNVNRAHIADVTTVLYHFKFTAAYKTILQRALAEGQYFGGSLNYRGADAVLRENPSFSLMSPNAQVLRNARQLVELGFLGTSSAYEQWLVNHNTPVPLI